MNWSELNNYFETSYNFFSRTTANNCFDTRNYPIHPIIKSSAAVALKTIESPTQNRIVILFPNRLDNAKWISTLCTLEIMRQDFNKHSSENITFKKEQRLFLGKHLVEFVEEYFEPRAGCMFMCIKCSDGLLKIPLNRKLQFKPADTKKQLSPGKKVLETYKSAQIIDSRLDKILGMRSLDNMSLFHDCLIFVTKIGTTESFVKNTCINAVKIIDLFMWGKLDSQGNLSKMRTDQVDAKPTCIVSSDLFGASHYIADHQENSKGVIIDGSAGFVNHLQILDDEVLKRNIPAVVVGDCFDCESLEHLLERGFRIWQWNSKNIVSAQCVEVIPKASPYYSLNCTLSNYCNQTIKVEECNCTDLAEAFRDIRVLDRSISEVSQLKAPYGRLVSSILEVSRIVRIPDKNWIDLLRNRIQNIRTEFIAYSVWLSDDIMKLIEGILRRVLNFIEFLEKGENPKVSAIGSLLNNIPATGIYIVVPKAEDVTPTTDYWKGILSSQQLAEIHFLSVSECNSAERVVIDPQVILCGWMGHEKMFSALHSHIFPQMTLLLYPFEKSWFVFAWNRWDKQNNHTMRSKDFSPIIGIPESDLHIIDHEPERPVISTAEREEFNIIDFELKMNFYRYAGYAAIRPGDEVIKARLLVFTQNKFSFITDKHKLLVITDIIKGISLHQDIPRKTIDELQIGDYVIFRESGKDIIREIADKGLEKQGLSNMRTISQLWKRALREKYISLNDNLEKFSALLEQHGCKRTDYTLRKWLLDEDTIGTKHDSDIDAIAKATGNVMLNDNIVSVKEAISMVRSAHLQASGFITRKLLVALPGVIDSEQQQIDFSTEEANDLDLDEYGKVNILRIDDIGRDTMDIEVKWVNRLLTKEDR